MNDYLPVALLHLREAEIVRVCGLTRAARGQEYARTDKVRQAERAAGTLQGTVLEDERTRAAVARFSESGLDNWGCSCSQGPADSLASADQMLPTPGARQPCEHVAALLYLWVRTPEAFLVSDDGTSQQSAPGGTVHAGVIPSAPAGGDVGAPRPTPADEDTGDTKNVSFASNDPLGHLPRVLPLLPLVSSSGEGGAASQGEALPDQEAAPLGERIDAAPEALPPEAGLREAQASERLPILLLLVAALVVDRSEPASDPSSAPRPAVRALPDPDAALLKRWAQQLNIPPEQVRFCFALLRLLGLLPAAPSAGRPLFSHVQARETLLRAWRVLLARRPAEVLRDLFTHWLHAHSARELVELRDAGVRVAWLSQRDTARSTDIAAENQAARQFVVNLLRRVPGGRWWSFGSLVDVVWRFQPDFLRGHQQLFLRPHWWLERLPDGQPLAVERRADWRQGEGRYLALLVRRALHWLGVMDLALDTQGRLKGFRITPLGAFLLGAAPDVAGAPMPAAAADPAPEVAAPPLDALVGALQPLEDGQVLASFASLNEAALETLLWWCEPVGATAEGLRFLPGAERVAAALDGEQPLEAWLTWLEQSQQRERFDPLIEQMRRWAAMYGQARLYESVTLLEVADAALLPELEATLHLSTQFVDHLLAPGLAVLRPDAAESLVGELRRRGYDPWITTHETAD